MNWVFFIVFGVVIAILLSILKTFLETDKNEELLPYREKKYFFSRSEQEFFSLLTKSIDHTRYLIFPKVRLADFIEVTIKGKEYLKWWNKIKSKHIDYLIWDIRENKIVLAIELDGKSHNSEKMKKRDEFVNELYKKIGIKLERVEVGDDFLDKLSQLLNH